MIQTYVLWQTPILKHLRLPTKETLSTRGKRESVSHSWPQPKPKVSVHFSRFPENQTAQKAKYDEMYETHLKSETKWHKYIKINTGQHKGEEKKNSDLWIGQRAPDRVRCVRSQCCWDPQIPKNSHISSSVSLLRYSLYSSRFPFAQRDWLSAFQFQGFWFVSEQNNK